MFRAMKPLEALPEYDECIAHWAAGVFDCRCFRCQEALPATVEALPATVEAAPAEAPAPAEKPPVPMAATVQREPSREGLRSVNGPCLLKNRQGEFQLGMGSKTTLLGTRVLSVWGPCEFRRQDLIIEMPEGAWMSTVPATEAATAAPEQAHDALGAVNGPCTVRNNQGEFQLAEGGSMTLFDTRACCVYGPCKFRQDDLVIEMPELSRMQL